MAATVHQQDVSTSATTVNPRDVATFPDQLDLFVAHTHMLYVHPPTGNWPSATCLRVVDADPLPSHVPVGALTRLTRPS